jgi:hypothetical protein
MNDRKKDRKKERERKKERKKEGRRGKQTLVPEFASDFGSSVASCRPPHPFQVLQP